MCAANSLSWSSAVDLPRFVAGARAKRPRASCATACHRWLGAARGAAGTAAAACRMCAAGWAVARGMLQVDGADAGSAKPSCDD